MRMSRLFGRTLRDAPANIDEPGLQLLVRAGMVRPVAGGIHALLPLGKAVLAHIEARARQELEKLEGQEVWLPAPQPADWSAPPVIREWLPFLTPFSDAAGRQFTMAADGAGLVARLAGPEVRSYRQLPAVLYAAGDRWSDSQGRGGLLAARATRVLESFALAPGAEAAAEQAIRFVQGAAGLFAALGIAPRHVPTAGGVAFFQDGPGGDETLLRCPGCDYSALAAEAAFAKPAPAEEAPLAVEKVATPGTKTIAELAALLGVPESRTAKAVFVMGMLNGAERFIFAVVRGDTDVSEAKLARAAGLSALRPATEDEIRRAGAAPGYASPVGLKDVIVIVDDLVARSPNLVAGANDEGHHLLNTNLGRDYRATTVADIVAAHTGDACPHCGGRLESQAGAVVGSVRRLEFTAAAPQYLDAQGRTQPLSITTLRLDLLRLLACVADRHRDEQGLLWPVAVAPYPVHLVSLGGAEAEAEALYAELGGAGIDVLLDDRNDSPGVKFADADLIGIPVRLTIGKRSLQQGGVELKARDRAERRVVALGEVLSEVKAELLACGARQANRG